MTSAVDTSCWPLARIAEALTALSEAANLGHAQGETTTVVAPPFGDDRQVLEPWLDAVGRSLHLEVDPLRPHYGKLGAALVAAGPALLHIPRPSATDIVALLGVRGESAHLLGPDGVVRKVRVREIADRVRAGFDREAESRVDALLDKTGIAANRRARARVAMLEEELAERLVEAGFTVSLPPSASFLRQLAHAGVPRRLVGLIGLQLAMQALSLGAWWFVGRGALDGTLAPGWLVAWALMLATSIPFRVLASWWQGTAALDFSTLLKRRLLFGILRLEPEESRQQGTGQLLGKVIEADAVESTITSGALGSALAIVELLVAGVVLGGSAGSPSVLLLVAWTAGALLLSWRYLHRLRAWTASRLSMTHELVERMVGHRTRLAQEPRDAWHDGEDALLSAYANRSADVDRLASWLGALVPRGWLLFGLVSIAPSFVDPTRSGAVLAVSLGGVILAYRALAKLTAGTSALLGALVAWAQASSLFHAGGREEPTGAANLTAAMLPARSEGPVLDARNLVYRYRDRGEPVLRNIDLQIRAGDRALLQGPSGGGKSTLGALLTGLRVPDSGLLLLRGLDRHALGPHAWRRRVVAAPQFHENHVLSATFAFNVLMGRRWPPRHADYREASDVCRELGLGPLLDRMPSGIMQMVGETGWQLSHGERSRLFIARALLQNADLVVLDESFAALDPDTLERALRYVIERARTLIVIAHP